MKKSLTSLLMAATMLFTLSACGSDQGTDPTPSPVPEEPSAPVAENTPAPEDTMPAEPDSVSGSKVLVACFSATGNTMPLAEYAADILGADLYEIVPQEPYTEADLAYYTDCRADREQEDDTARPVISGGVENMEQYDTVLLGYPIWHGRPPRIIYTFLEGYEFAGKTVIPFCTSGSSPYNDSGIKDLVGSDTTWVTGQRFAAGTSREAIADWLGTLELGGSSSAEDNILYLTVNGHTLTATLVENSTQALKELLADGPLTIDMSDYGSMEKVGPLGTDLPRNDEQITTGPGDLILYQGNSLVLYYDRNNWNFTRLGKVNNVTDQELREILGTGSVSMTLSLAE